MAPVELEGETLGEKHRSFNKIVDKATNDPTYILEQINFKESDIDNLIKIEVASRRKNVDVILEAFKSKDTLYAFRAIKLSAWLITSEQHEHFINPIYIHENLLPHMTLKAFNKLMTKIRLTLRVAKRVDEFFNYFKDNDLNRAFKWLPYCSSTLAEEVIHKYSDKISYSVIEKFKLGSNSVYIYCKKNKYNYNDISKIFHILKENDTEKYLSFLFDWLDAWYHIDKLSAKTTKRIIKKCSHKTLDDFLCFVKVIHLPTLVKYFSGQEIKQTLIRNSRSKRYESLYKYDKLKYFVARLPKEDKYSLIKNVFIGKVKPVYTNETDLENSTLVRCLTNMNNAYLWCEFLPFDDAFKELKIFIDAETNPAKRSYMLCTLLSSAHKNYDNIQTVLQYYLDSHLLEGFRFRTQFLQHLLHEVNTLKFNSEAWNLLNILFYSVGVYTKMENSFPLYKQNPFIIIGKHRRSYGTKKLQSDEIFVNCIILYNVIHGIDIPEMLLSKFKYNTFKHSLHKLDNEQKIKLFDFLFQLANTNIEKQNVKDVNNFENLLLNITNVLHLIRDWNKNVDEYPEVLSKIREFTKLYSHDPQKYNCSELAGLAKSMKFELVEPEESSIILADLCMNSLKSNPQYLLEILNKEGILWKFDRRSMRRFLCKLRVYWHDSLAVKLKSSFNKTKCELPWSLLSEKEVWDLIQKHFSTQEIICNNDSVLKTEIAKHLHLFRPQVPLEKVLELCEENKLEYFLSTIHSLIYNMNPSQTTGIFLKIHNLCSSRKKPSFQKHCLKIGLKRLNCKEKKKTLIEIWKRTENDSVRFLVFEETFALFTDEEKVLDFWGVLSGFIDDIKENLDIVKLLCNSRDIPKIIISDYYEKIRNYLQKHSDEDHLLVFRKNFAKDSEAKAKELQEIFKAKMYDRASGLQDYLIEVASEKIQMDNYQKILVPVLEDETIMSFDTAYIFIVLLRKLCYDLYNNVLRSKIVPLAMFTDIQRRFEEKLPFYDNYVLITAGRLQLGYLRLLEKNMKILNDDEEITRVSEVEFGEYCADYLDQEIEKHFQRIYMPFSDALCLLCHLTEFEISMRFIDAMLKHNPRVECFLVFIHDFPRKTFSTPDDILFCGILDKMKTHPSEEIRMLYSNYFIKTDSL